MDIQKTVICVVLLLLMQVSISFAAAGATRNALYHPDDYEGKTVIFEKAKIGGPILKNSHTELYCLNVEIGGKYTPGFLYRSQLNFVVISPEFADKLTTQLDRTWKQHKPHHEQNDMDHLNSDKACSVRLTAKIQKSFGYWLAVVSKIEFFGRQRTITNTVK